MTKWKASIGEIFETSADALICSANPQLNLSGGVGGEILRRHGPGMQEFLHDWLRDRGQRFVSPGNVVVAPPCCSSFRAIIHAVAIDAFYETSPELIRQAYHSAFSEAVTLSCQTVVAACLACGYGRASSTMFIDAIRDMVSHPIAGIDSIHFVSTNADLIGDIQRLIQSHNDRTSTPRPA